MELQIFCPAVQPFHDPPCQPVGKIGRDRPAQIAAPHGDPNNRASLHDRGKPPADGFYFWQFGHGFVFVKWFSER
jgi:hypothetical protein